MRNFMRENKTYCGKKYLEVDIFPYTKKQQEASKGTRSKKRKVTEPKQRNLNDKNAKRYLRQLTNANFGAEDIHLSLTYKDKYLPNTEEEAKQIVTNYLRKIDYHMKKQGLGALKYIIITEYVSGENGEIPVRIHHHLYINGGLDRDLIEDLWCRRRKKGEKKGEKLGYVNADRLQPEGNGVAALSKYLTKNPSGKKRWSSSKNLERPKSRPNDHKYSKREIERIAKNPPSPEYWKKEYPGWTLAEGDYAFKAEYNEVTGWSVYLKFYRRD